MSQTHLQRLFRSSRSFLLSLMLLLGTHATAAFADDTPVPGGTITFAQNVDVFRFDPFDVANGNLAMLNTVYDPLVRVDANGVPQPWLVKSWKWNDSATELTLSIEPHVQFQSGREMTADDVKWTIEQYQDPANAANIQQATLLIKSIDVLDPQTLVLKFDAPFATVFDVLELIYVIDSDGKDNLRNTPAGTGPYKLVEWDPGVEAKYTKNPNYWRKGEPLLDGFVQKVFPDQQAMVAALEAGAVDVVMFPSVQDFTRLKNNPAYTEYYAPSCCEVNVNFNTANPPWNNKLVRQAINHAIDRQRFVDVAYQGNSKPICQPILSGWAHDPSISVDNQCKYDLGLAKSLLAQAGYANGFKIQALVSTTAMAESPILAQIMKDDLAKLNIDLEIQDLDQTAYNNTGDKSLYKDIYIQPVGRTNKDPGSLFALTVAFRPQTNVAQFHNQEYEDLIQKGLETVDPDERAKIYHRIAQIVTDEDFSLVVAPMPEFYISKSSVKGFELSRDGMLHTDQLWISK